MKKLLNTLYVTTPQAYLALDGENVVVQHEDATLGRVPLHTLEGIVAFNYPGASPALLGACAQRGVDICFFTPNNRFLARVCGETKGNPLLRKTQHQWAQDPARQTQAARYLLIGKVYNQKWVIERTLRDHGERVEAQGLRQASQKLSGYLDMLADCGGVDALRGIEAVAASAYFGVFDHLILGDKAHFSFSGRSRRPPLDPVNALLSFCYALLAREVAAALEGVGLDPYIGFMHADRSGRPSLALDMMEELRAPMADRFVLSLLNRRMVDPKAFHFKENGAVLMDDALRRDLLTQWQSRKQEVLTHPYLEEKLPWGMVPHAQALLMSRWLRGDLEGYPPFLWK
ncbi:MAG: type I-C CRISPR-associated endonuclease Cas1c [Candidatus Limiplasma sp.]|nr:type I-C CRISPR-associated endonuclease Cas1c [Candidatus Limiplasma sp.]